MLELPRQVHHVDVGDLGPAVGGHFTVLGVQAHDHMPGELLAHVAHEPRLFDRLGADDHPLNAGVQIGLDGLGAADTAADLDRQARMGAGDGVNDLAVHRLTGEGAVQVHQVQAPGALLHPVVGHRHRVLGKYRIVVHAALLKAYAVAVFQIDGGNQFHDDLACLTG